MPLWYLALSGCIRSFRGSHSTPKLHTRLTGTNWHGLSLSRSPPWLSWHLSCRKKGEVPTTLTLKNQKVQQRNARRNRLPTWKDSKDPDPKNHRKNWDFFYWTFGIPRAFLANQKAKPQSRWQFQMSHIEACPGSFTKRWNPVVGPSNSAKPCIFEGTTAIDRQRIKAESQRTAVQRSNLSISSQILPAVHKRCDGRKWYVVAIVETAALLLQSCLHHARMVVYRTKNQLSETSTYW